MQKVLAVRADGSLSMCSVPPELRGTGRCNHIGHINEGESVEQFCNRMERTQNVSIASNHVEDSKPTTKELEIESYHMTEEEKQNMPEITGRKQLADPENNGGYIHLDTPLWNDFDKETFAAMSGCYKKDIQEVLRKRKHIVTYINRANEQAAKYHIGQIFTEEGMNKIKGFLGNDIQFDTGVTGMNLAAKEGFDFEPTSDIYVLPYFMRQDAPDGSKNILNVEYNAVIVKRKDPQEQQLAYERLLDNQSLASKSEVYGTKKEAEALEMRGYKVQSLSDLFKGKGGLVAGYMGGNTVAYSGRAVATPDWDVKYGELALPASMATTIFRPTIEDVLSQQGYDKKDIGKWCKKYQKDPSELTAEDRKELQDVLDFAEVSVIGNRQPSLHEASMLGFKPVISPDKTIHQCPMCIDGLNADYDGDTFTVYAINDWGISRDVDEEMGSRSVYATNRPRLKNDSIIKPSKDVLFGLLSILPKE